MRPAFSHWHYTNITSFYGNCAAVAEGYCNTVTDGEGWLVVQWRQDHSDGLEAEKNIKRIL